MSSGNSEDALYWELAPYYDMIYGWKAYDAETKFLRKLIGSKKKSLGNRLLDVGCGTGRHISLLRDSFDCTGMDLSTEMLKVAKRNVKGVEFVQGDMSAFQLGSKFDVILCLFSAIAYTRTDAKLKSAINNFSRHLNDGGIVVIQPWVPKSKWIKGHIAMQTHDSEEVKIARLSYSGGDSKRSTFREEYLIAVKGRGIRHVVEDETFPYFDRPKYERMMRAAGLSVEYVSNKLFDVRGLLVGVKEAH